MTESVHDLLEEVRLSGASICLDGDRLRISPAGLLSDDLLARLRGRAGEISDHLGGIEIVPRDQLSPGEMLADNLRKAQRFHSVFQ